MVNKAGVGTLPVSILRSVSAETPAAAAASAMLSLPRTCRSSEPNRSPRSRSQP
ncbi:MAG: hypothetical protein K0R62_5140 [Nonomuraea muscovyensis]|nr:hypothetical protein [Nonomuraea muscovyensis]